MNELKHCITISVGATAGRILASEFLVEIMSLFPRHPVYNLRSVQPPQLGYTSYLRLV